MKCLNSLGVFAWGLCSLRGIWVCLRMWSLWSVSESLPQCLKALSSLGCYIRNKLPHHIPNSRHEVFVTPYSFPSYMSVQKSSKKWKSCDWVWILQVIATLDSMSRPWSVDGCFFQNLPLALCSGSQSLPWHYSWKLCCREVLVVSLDTSPEVETSLRMDIA